MYIMGTIFAKKFFVYDGTDTPTTSNKEEHTLDIYVDNVADNAAQTRVSEYDEQVTILLKQLFTTAGDIIGNI